MHILNTSARKAEADGSLSLRQPGLQRQPGLHGKTLSPNPPPQKEIATSFLESINNINNMYSLIYLHLGFLQPETGKVCTTTTCHDFTFPNATIFPFLNVSQTAAHIPIKSSLPKTYFTNLFNIEAQGQ